MHIRACDYSPESQQGFFLPQIILKIFLANQISLIIFVLSKLKK